jgi:hypothetical protein
MASAADMSQMTCLPKYKCASYGTLLIYLPLRHPKIGLRLYPFAAVEAAENAWSRLAVNFSPARG